MYLRYLFVIVSVIVYYLLQVSVFPAITFLTVTPNLLLSFTICYALLRGKKAGMLCGILCGLVWDILVGSLLGLSTFCLLILGYVTGIFSDTLSPEDAKFPTLIVFTGDLLFGMTTYFILFLFRRQFDFEYYFLNIMMPEAVFSALMTLLIFPITYKIHSALLKYEKRRSIKFG